MSYILDALRRAEAERQRGTVPGLHAQPATRTLPAGPDGHDTAQRNWRPGTWVLAGLLLAGLLVAAAGLGWLLKPTPAAVALTVPSAPPPAAVRSAVPAVPPQAAAPAGGGAPAQLPTQAAVAPVLPLISPVARPFTEPAPAPTRPLVAAAPAVTLAAPAPTAALAAPTTAPTTAPDAPAPAAPAPAPAVAGPGTAPVRLPTLAELPEALRREVQPLNLGGSVYAEQPPLRIVIINGQVFHEGDKPLPALLVQQIRLKSVVFSVRGQRFEVPL